MIFQINLVRKYTHVVYIYIHKYILYELVYQLTNNYYTNKCLRGPANNFFYHDYFFYSSQATPKLSQANNFFTSTSIKTIIKCHLINKIQCLIYQKLFFILGVKYNYNNEHIYENLILNHNIIHYVSYLFVN